MDSETESSSDDIEQDPGGVDLDYYLLLRRILMRETNTVEELINSLDGTLITESIIEAFKIILREHFVLPEQQREAYTDSPLRFAKMGFNISAPHMHALCLENLDIQPGNTILDIGSGSGCFTALASYLTGPEGIVHGLDIYDHIIEFAGDNLKRVIEDKEKNGETIDFSNITFYQRNCFLPSPLGMTYDRIHVGCCCPESRIQFLYDMLSPGGILVTPYGDHLMKAWKDEDGKVHTKVLMAVRFSDLLLPSEAEIKEAYKQIEIEKAKNIYVPPEKIKGDILTLVNNKRFSDVTFEVQGTIFYAHKLILMNSSKYFESLLMTDESLSNIIIDDCDPKVFLAFLEMMYGGPICIEMVENVEMLINKYSVRRDLTGQLPLLYGLVGNTLFSDVEFILEDRTIRAHKLILEIRCEYFNSLFRSGLRESQEGKINISNCTSSTFVELLRYIYTGECKLTLNNWVSVLEQANYFQLDRLIALCEEFWRHNISIENAASVLEVATRFNAKQLLQYSLEFIFQNVEEVTNSEAWRELDIELVSQVLIAAVNRSK